MRRADGNRRTATSLPLAPLLAIDLLQVPLRLPLAYGSHPQCGKTLESLGLSRRSSRRYCRRRTILRRLGSLLSVGPQFGRLRVHPSTKHRIPLMSIQRRHRAFAIAGTAAAFVVIASNSLAAAGLDLLSASSASITVESLGPPMLVAGASGAWILYSPTLSVDCSPPRGCYAKTQRIHYDFSCVPRYIVLTERISMDLNGAIIKDEVQDAASYPASYDAGAMRVLDTFCPLPNRD